MLVKGPNLKFLLKVAATALLLVVGPTGRTGKKRQVWRGLVGKERPFGEPQSAEEPHDIELGRARERGRGRHATHPLQIPWHGWYDILWRTYREMQSDRLLSIAGGVAFFVLLAIFPAITALVSAYGLFFSPSIITNPLSARGADVRGCFPLRLAGLPVLVGPDASPPITKPGQQQGGRWGQFSLRSHPTIRAVGSPAERAKFRRSNVRG